MASFFHFKVKNNSEKIYNYWEIDFYIFFYSLFPKKGNGFITNFNIHFMVLKLINNYLYNANPIFREHSYLYRLPHGEIRWLCTLNTLNKII